MAVREHRRTRREDNVLGRSAPKEPRSAAKRAMRRAGTGAPTQQRLTDAALTLFATKGYAATGIREIAEAADLTSAALYHYIGSKEDLLIHLMTEGLQRFVAASRAALV